MKILVYGAGPLGSLLATRLERSGQDVTLLARGEQFQQLRQNGIMLQNLISGERIQTQVRVVETLHPDDYYDWIVVVMGKNHVLSSLPDLSANALVPNILFLGNNAAGSNEYCDALGVDRVLMGFLGAVGTREDGVVKYLAEYEQSRARVRIGELDGRLSERLLDIGGVLESAGFEVQYSQDIDAWLKTHAVFILGLAGAYNIAGRDIERVVNTRDALVMMVRAVREGLRVLSAHHIPIRPKSLLIFSLLPEPILVTWLKKFMSGETFKYGLVHAGSAGPEMVQLSRELAHLTQATSVRTPYMDTFRVHMQPGSPKMPPGSEVIRLRWGEVVVPAVIMAVIISAVIVVLRWGGKSLRSP
jgi:2-dehydropantoate 2-reductase